MKFAAVVDRDRAHGARLGGNELPRAAVHVGARLVRQLPDREKARFALDEREHTRAAVAGA
jgi:hypothetical protein